MKTEEKRISIFLDTNILQTFFGSKKDTNVFLDKTGVPVEYYQLTDFINKYWLEKQIEICIPGVVVMECKQHMQNCFSKNIKQLTLDNAKYKKIFGSLIEFEYDLKLTEKEYIVHTDELFEAFVSDCRNKCKIVQYNKDESLIEILLSKALSGTKPFIAQTIEGKTHSDAGFKDAIIAETIYSYCKEKSSIGILVSTDNDFAEPFQTKLSAQSNYVQFHSIQETIKALEEFFDINTVQKLKQKFSDNTYLQESLLQEAGIKLDKSVTEQKITDISNEDENVFNIKMDFTVNETKYHFFVKFDSAANDIIDCNYKFEND